MDGGHASGADTVPLAARVEVDPAVPLVKKGRSIVPLAAIDEGEPRPCEERVERDLLVAEVKEREPGDRALLLAGVEEGRTTVPLAPVVEGETGPWVEEGGPAVGWAEAWKPLSSLSADGDTTQLSLPYSSTEATTAW